MKNDKEKFKTEFKLRIYKWVLKLIEFLDALPKDTISQRIIDRHFRFQFNHFERTEQIVK